MNTKVNKLVELYNMRSHKANRIVSLLEHHLPKRFYALEVTARCKKKRIEVSPQIVRDVKNFRTKNSKVLDIIVGFAVENEKAQNRIEENLKK